MDLVHARCAHEGCITSPSYGSAADGRYARFFPRRSWLLLTASGTPVIPCGFPCPKRGNVMGSPAGPLPHVAPDRGHRRFYDMHVFEVRRRHLDTFCLRRRIYCLLHKESDHVQVKKCPHHHGYKAMCRYELNLSCASPILAVQK